MTDRGILAIAYCAGQLAARQLQPITDNPHERRSPEWQEWVSGWQSFRYLVADMEKLREKVSRLEKTLVIQQRTLDDLHDALMDEMIRAEQEKERAEFAEEAARQAMTEGLARAQELEKERDHWGRAFEDALNETDALRERVSELDGVLQEERSAGE